MKSFSASKKTVFAIVAMLFVLSALTSRVKNQSVKAEPDTLTVPFDYEKIQWAIGNASSGDTISVSQGTYYEHLSIDKSLTLIGESKKNTIIDGSGENRTIIEIIANNVVISGFSVQNTSQVAGTSYAGIRVSGGGCNVSDNIVSGTKVGIFVTSQKNQIRKNVVRNNGHGIALHSASEVTVEGNNASANTVGISLALSSNNMIAENSAVNSSIGGHGIILSTGSFDNTIFSNYLVGNYHGMWLSDSYDNVIMNNTIERNELLGIELASSTNNTFYHNNFIDNPKHIVIDNKSISIWDNGYPSGGNYWHGYVDADEKSGPNQDQDGPDGISDHPYIIDNDNIDRYPIFYDRIPLDPTDTHGFEPSPWAIAAAIMMGALVISALFWIGIRKSKRRKRLRKKRPRVHL